jgi:NAD(P)-dependent dehydrogenase (short-subunit alcohol dehydrogenase family)
MAVIAPPFAQYAAPGDLLRERVIIVTGAANGIGRAAAAACAAHGATVVLLDKALPQLETLHDEIVAKGQPQPAIYPLNLEGAGTRDYENLRLTIATEFGRLDALLHCAAMLGDLTPIRHYDTELWARVMQVNINASFLLTQACLPLMDEAVQPVIVYLSAATGRRGRANWGAYTASKFAQEGLMQVLADELEGRVLVCSLDPGGVRTTLRAAAFPAEDPLSLITPEELIPVFLYLLGPEGQGLHGQAVNAQ